MMRKVMDTIGWWAGMTLAVLSAILVFFGQLIGLRGCFVMTGCVMGVMALATAIVGILIPIPGKNNWKP